MKEYLDAAVRLIADWAQCLHVGIRILSEDGSIPYTSCIGFTSTFLKTENSLSVVADQCVCTCVIGGRAEPQDMPSMTPYGSFYTNDLRGYFNKLTKEQKDRFRGACFKEGYQSLAVVPIKYRDRVLGAIHLADGHKDMMPAERVAFLEQIGFIIGEAVYRFGVEEELRRKHDALQKSNELLENMFSNIHVMVAFMDRDFNFIRVNRAYAEAEGRKPDFFVGKNHFDLYPNEENERIFRSVVETGEPYSVSEKPFEYAGHPERGVTYWDWSLVPVKDGDGNVSGVVLSLINVTGRRRAMDELRTSREMLRKLSAHIDAVREGERTNIAREIHDELGQALTAIKIEASRLKNKLADAALRSKAENVISLVDQTIQSVRRISQELRPGVLDELDLAAAIEWATREFEKRTGIECEFRYDPENIPLDRNRSTTIFRVMQEALTNTARHAGATKVSVSLTARDGFMVLTVKDNGKGISKSEVFHSNSFGIIGMRERVEFLGGRFSITGAPGKRTTLTVTIPLERDTAV